MIYYITHFLISAEERKNKKTKKNSPTLNFIQKQSHHSPGHIWIGCLDTEFAKGLACNFKGLTTAPYPLSKWWSPRGFLRNWLRCGQRQRIGKINTQIEIGIRVESTNIDTVLQSIIIPLKNCTQHFSPQFSAQVCGYEY